MNAVLVVSSGVDGLGFSFIAGPNALLRVMIHLTKKKLFDHSEPIFGLQFVLFEILLKRTRFLYFFLIFVNSPAIVHFLSFAR